MDSSGYGRRSSGGRVATEQLFGVRLSISPQTVSSHLMNVYSKLRVHNRRQAVARAREIAFLPPA
jgi:DNA-binding CsgD family transcriptional regulator